MANKRKKKKKKAGRLKRKMLYVLLILLGTTVILSSLLILTIYLGLFGKLPDQEEIRGIRQSNASLVYASDGSLMGKYYKVNRQSIENESMSIHVRHALIATEDNRFFEHHGVDLISLGRVFTKSLLMGNLDQGGGSTISQQLAKNLYKRKDYGAFSILINKIREMFIASELEKTFSKEDILTLYLNTVSFGENVYGIEAAAWRFFGKPSADLNISESATLIGMLAANTSYNPRLHPENAMKRRNIVFSRMHTQGFISGEEADKLKQKPIILNYRLMDINNGTAPYFRDFVRIRAEKILDDKYDLESDGLRIFTTINPVLQSYAEEAVEKHMKKLQDEFDHHWKGREPWESHPAVFEDKLKQTEPYRKLQASGTATSEILEALSVKHKRNIFTQNGEEVVEISTLDSLKHYTSLLNTGFLAMDAISGAVLAWVGGTNFQYLPYDHVISKRQAGSTFKPFVYAAALEQGMKPCQIFLNEKKVYDEFDGWSPGNSNGNYEGFYSMQGGLMNSVNTITAAIMAETGPASVVELAHSMGVRSDLPEYASIALGTAEVSLLEMISAYTGFANTGNPQQASFIRRIEDSDGNVIYRADNDAEQEAVFSQETAVIMNSMLQAVVDSGTASSARKVYGLKSDLAGKTGTTQNNADGWFIGYSPNLVIGVWVGAESPAVHFRTTALGSGSHMALPIFAHTIKMIEDDASLRYEYLTNFPAVDDTIAALMDCPSYSRTIPVGHLNRREAREFKRELKNREESSQEEEKTGFFKKIGNFFKRKKK